MANESDKPSLAVDLKNVSKHYRNGFSKTEILKDVDLSVYQGSIYALLGPSGCGKTTLLKCIIGRFKPDKGNIIIFGQKVGSKSLKIPGANVGYMPQELALYNYLKIDEILSYFGKVYGMNTDNVSLRITFLLNLLHLPEGNCLIKKLSGGEKRRVSLAIALICNPPLMILDEPTSGVDPILRQSIWNHLSELTSSGKVTVILSTHNTAEARLANRVGFMRNGKMLMEDSPEAILNETGTLEDVFIEFCVRDNEEESSTLTKEHLMRRKQLMNLNEQNDSERNQNGNIADKCFNHNICISFTNIVAVATRNFKMTMKCYGMLALQFVVPLMFTFIFLCTFGQPLHDLPLAVVNLDNHSGSMLLNLIDNQTIHQIPVPDIATGSDMVLDRSAVGVIEIPTNFTTSVTARSINPLGMPLELLNSTNIKLYLDMTNIVVVQTLQEKLLRAYEDHVKIILKEKDLQEHLTTSPFTVDQRMRANNIYSFNERSLPSTMILVIFTMSMLSSGILYFYDKIYGIMDRNIVAGVKLLEELLGLIPLQFGIAVIQVSIILLLAIVGFNITYRGNLGLVMVFSVLVAFCGMFYGFVLTIISDSEIEAISLSSSSIFLYLLLSGCLWPSEGLPIGLQRFCKFLPPTIANEAIGNVMLRGMDMSDSTIWISCLSYIAWIFVILFLSLFIAKIKI